MCKTTVKKILILSLLFFFNNFIWSQSFINIGDKIKLPVPIMIQWDRSATRLETDSIMDQYGANLVDSIYEEKFNNLIIDKYEIYKVPDTIITYLDFINFFDCDTSTGVNGTGTSLGGRAKKMDLDYPIGIPNTIQNCSYTIQNYHPYPHCEDLAYPDSSFYADNCISFISEIEMVIIDSGVDGEAPLLNDLYNNNRNYNFINNTTNVKDTGTRHGSYVAKTIIGTIGQTKANIKLRAYKVLEEDGTGTIFNVLRAITKATHNNIDLVNLSLGAFILEEDGCTNVLESVLEFAETENTLIIAAAGNDTADVDNTYYFPASFSNNNLIIFGATNCWDSISPFSNFGFESVDLFAPGNNIVVGGNECKNGTSFSTSIGASFYALKAATLPTFNANQIKNIALEAVDKKAEWYKYVRTGGVINPFKLFENGCWNNCDPE